jgi:hypothetical protein
MFKFAKMLFMRKFLFWLIGLIIVFLAVYIFINMSYTYSDGNRAGRLIKFSHKGYVFKTYEGELNLGGINNTNGGVLMNNIWLFSVADKSVADSLSQYEGRDVVLHYKEKLSTLPWRGDSKYIVDGIVPR